MKNHKNLFITALFLHFTVALHASAATQQPSTPIRSPSPTPAIVTSFNGSLGVRYDNSTTPENLFQRVQESVVFGFTITPRGVVDLVGMVQTGSLYGKKWSTAIDLNDRSKDTLNTTLYFKQIFLQKRFKTFGMPASAQFGILGTTQRIGTKTFIGPVTALGTNSWTEGGRVSLQTHLGDLSVVGGSILDVNNANILTRDREMNYLEVQVSKKIFNALAVEASAGKYDGEAFFRGAAEYELTLVSEHIIRLAQEAFYSNQNLNYSTSASTDLGAFFDKNLTGRVNLDLRYSYLAPDSDFSGLRMNDLTLKGHVISTALYGKIDKAGRVNWFAAKDFLDIKRTQAGLIWNLKGGNKK